MSGLITDLTVAGKLAMRATRARFTSSLEPTPDLGAFEAGMQAILDTAADDLVLASQWLTIPATQAPWVNSEISVAVGEEVSYFVEGRTIVSKLLDVWIHPSLQLWCKIGEDGEVFRGTRNQPQFYRVQQRRFTLWQLLSQ